MEVFSATGAYLPWPWFRRGLRRQATAGRRGVPERSSANAHADDGPDRPVLKASPIFSDRHDDRRDAAVRPWTAACAADGVPRRGLDFHCERPHVLGRSASHGLREQSEPDRRANRWFWAAPCPME